MALKNTQNTVVAPSVSSLKTGYAAGVQNMTQRTWLPTKCTPSLVSISVTPHRRKLSGVGAVFEVVVVVSVYPHRLLAFSQNVRPGEGSVPTGPTTGKLQSLMTSRAEKGTQDLMR